MDNAQKAIMVGVGLFITIIIIAAVMLITGIGTNLVNKGTNKAGNVAAQLDQTELEQYDNTRMSGAQVLSAVKKYNTDSNIVVYLINGSAKTATTPKRIKTNSISADSTTNPSCYTASGDIEDITAPSLGQFTQVGGANYISGSSQWHAYLLKKNGSSIGIVFVRQ